jgi:hypothetical protein
MDGFESGNRSMKEQAQRLDTDVKKMGVKLNKLYAHYKGNLGANNNRMLALERQVSGLATGTRAPIHEGEFEFGQQAGDTPQHSLLQMELQEMREEIAELKRAQSHNQAKPPVTQSGGNGMFPTPGLDAISSRLKVVETRGSTGVTFVLGGTTFTSEADIRSYITVHEIPSCAMYWDLFSVMVCMGAQGLTGKERSDRIYSAERGRTGSALEGELVASMSHKRPLCLYGEGAKLARLDEGFAMCKTYDQWIGGGNQVSYRQDLSTQILVYTDGILGQIGPPLTPAHNLAQVLRTKVGMQWWDLLICFTWNWLRKLNLTR